MLFAVNSNCHFFATSNCFINQHQISLFSCFTSEFSTPRHLRNPKSPSSVARLQSLAHKFRFTFILGRHATIKISVEGQEAVRNIGISQGKQIVTKSSVEIVSTERVTADSLVYGTEARKVMFWEANTRQQPPKDEFCHALWATGEALEVNRHLWS